MERVNPGTPHPQTTHHAPAGMVCSIDHLASAAGVAALRAGGSAVDAAVATNAVLAVTAPFACGLGGDLFALVHEGGTARPTALNSSGRAGSGADAERLRAEGATTMPFREDVRSVPVPGCADGWLAMHERYGRLPLADLFAAAIGYAEDGFPASPNLAATAHLIAGRPGAEAFTPPPAPGDRVRRPGVARALRAIAADGRDGFYLGEFGQGLLRVGDGEYTRADLERSQAEWVTPLRLRTYGHDVWTLPPNSQGYLLLLSLGIGEGLDLPEDADDPLTAHLMAEAARLAAYDRPALLHEGADLSGLLTEEEFARRRASISPDKRADVTDLVSDGDTTYLCAVDGDGMGVSVIQSNASGYGSWLFEPSTGINLHNRGLGFSVAAGHPAEYAPGRRPPHTLVATVVTHPDGSLRAVAGSMGGDAQPQIVQQVLTRLLKYGASPGEAVGAVRWRAASMNGFDTWDSGDAAAVAGLQVEEAASDLLMEGLAERGHPVARTPDAIGHAHVIDIGPDGMRAAAADPRAKVSAAAGH
ncbi:MAG: gamma-glutamyltranspeptidase [Streptosporangiales bacterium]|nr:gamma-glutamyltranspeptidase [Streptosporangiales bacterium]